MQAILLNSGTGSRMGKYTQNNPKCLVKFSNQKTILGYQIETLVSNDVKQLIITTGPFAEQIERFIEAFFPTVEVIYIHNPHYASTNYIYSLFLLSPDLIHHDILLLHGDLVFDQFLVQQVVGSPKTNFVLMNPNASPPEKDFKGCIENGFVRTIRVDLFGANCFLLIPFYKITKRIFLLWYDEIKNFVKRGETDVYAETAFNAISTRLNIKPFFFDEEFCMEIDTPKDLMVANQFFARGS